MMSQIQLPVARTESVSFIYKFHTTVDVLRLDEIHPVVSGNKWYKLKEYLADAALSGRKTIVTFGGAYSNHIVATAAACKDQGFHSVGIIRGEKPAILSHTLRHAMDYGMKLFFVSREEYKLKKVPASIFDQFKKEDVYAINEGGYGPLGVQGAEGIMRNLENNYTHIIAPVGTGTTLAGLIRATKNDQQVIGISAMKNNFSLQQEIEVLLPPASRNFTLMHQFHLGGYAKQTEILINFMNNWFERTGIPSDFVYTGKMFFAVNRLIEQGYFPDESRLLVIHTGGLQGNDSLPPETLIF